MKTRYFKHAQECANESSHKQKLGAVVVKGSRILSRGFNTMKTSPRSTHPWKSLHAEATALLGARCNIEGADIYVARTTHDGVIANSKPCPYCMKLIKSYGIKNVFYTDNEGYKKL